MTPKEYREACRILFPPTQDDDLGIAAAGRFMSSLRTSRRWAASGNIPRSAALLLALLVELKRLHQTGLIKIEITPDLVASLIDDD